MKKKEYEWTGKVPVWRGRAHKTGEVFSFTEAEAAEYLAFGAVELKSEADARRLAEAKAKADADAAKANTKPAGKSEVKSDGR